MKIKNLFSFNFSVIRSYFLRVRESWKNIKLDKCDYCGNLVKQWWDAWALPIKEYKGEKICIDCIHKLPQDDIVYVGGKNNCG